MNFRIIRPVTEPSKEVGQIVAWTFDCGRIESKKYDNGYIYGHIPGILPYIDIETMLDACPNRGIEKCSQEFFEVLFSFGFNYEMIDEASNGVSISYAQELLDVFIALHPENDVGESLIVGYLVFFEYQAEEIIDKIRINGGDASVIALDLIDVIKGTSAMAIPNSGIKMSSSMTSLAAMCHIIRTNAKKIDSSAWVYLELEMIDLVRAMELESRTKDITEENYYFIREHTIGVKIILEGIFIACGIKISEDLRFHLLFKRLITLVSIYLAFINDLLGLRRDVENGDDWNMILIRAKEQGFQSALELTVHETSELRYKIIQIQKELINIFPNETCLPHIFETIAKSEFFSTYAFTMEFAFHRYGNNINLTQSVIEYVEETNNISLETILPAHTIKVETYKNQVNNVDCLFEELHLIDKKERYIKVEQVTEMILKLGELDEKNSLPKFEADPTMINELNINHVAVIPDGNRRWAKSKGLEPHMGHKHGVQTMLNLVEKFFQLQIHTITVWGMSTENFQRPHHEKEALFAYMISFYDDVLVLAHKHETRVHHIGSTKRLSRKLRRLIAKAMRETANYTKHIINVAIDYGGIQEILDAVNKIEKLPITKEDFSKLMYTGNQPYPEPDVIIRTGSIDSKTVRTSGFMTWQSAYSEFVFLDKYMPDITAEDIDEIVDYFKKANRRFGK